MQTQSDISDNDFATFINTVPPPPYPGLRNDHASAVDSGVDLRPIPQIVNRPRLPEEKRNPHLRSLPEDATLVKFQTIVRDNREIVVGRIKVPTGLANNNNHAFILRRYDTNAISLTTMYKVAFPGASEEDERREMDWVKSSFDTRDTNGGRNSDVVRLAGQWVSRHLAIHLAPAYHIEDLVAALARAAPDPNVAYRKSQRSQKAADEMSRQRDAQTVPSVQEEANVPAPKRQRRSSPDAAGSQANDEERHLTLEATTTLTAPNNASVDVEAEIQSAKQLVLDLKRELRLRAAVGEDLEDQVANDAGPSRGVKRGQDEEGVAISGGTTGDRVIRRNKRVEQGVIGETTKKVAWGALLFGLGIGATYLPNLF